MGKEKIAGLVVALNNATVAGRVVWSVTESDGIFQASFPNHSVRIYLVSNDSGFDDDYVLEIVNEFGEVVESVRDPELRGAVDEPYLFMRELYEMARRGAMGVDQAIDDIMRYL